MYIITGVITQPLIYIYGCDESNKSSGFKYSVCANEKKAKKFETYLEASTALLDLTCRVSNVNLRVEFKNTIVGGRLHYEKLLNNNNRI